MAKSDTIRMYREEFLAGKSPEAVAKFEAKDEKHQYQSIMTWRYNRRRKKKRHTDEIPAGTPEAILSELRRRILEDKDITEEMLDSAASEIALLSRAIEDRRRRMCMAEIERLEASRVEINERLRVLHGQVRDSGEPSIFDITD